ncbi:hypothetical protein COCC4DRAFT_29257, partial [Bipolaris maydis ATCC 48331]
METLPCRNNVYIATRSEVEARLATDVMTQGLGRRSVRKPRPTVGLANAGSCRGFKLRKNRVP